MKKRRTMGAVFILVLIIMVLLRPGCGEGSEKTYHLETGESALLAFHGIKRIAVGNPDVVDIRPLDSKELLVTAKAGGNSTLVVWDRKGRHFVNFLIHPSQKARRWEVENLLREDGISVSVTETAVVLEGTVDNPAAKARAEAIAKAYSPNVVNLLEVMGAPQIRLEANVVEMERTAAEKLGLQNLKTFGDGVVTGVVDLSVETDQLGFFLKHGHFYTDDIQGILNALEERNEAKILSRPYLTTLSGEEATLNVGGEIPVPVGLENGEIKIEWKPYGVILSFTPELDGRGALWLSMEAEVSEIDWENRIITSGIEIPALKTRQISNKVRLLPGQPLIVGGLIDNKQSELKSRIPILSDIPIIGELFKSKRFENSETELVITVTPHLEEFL